VNSQQIIAWVKSNVFIVILVAIMIAGVVGFPMWASTFSAKNEQKQEQYRKVFQDLDRLRKVDFTPPGSTESVQIVPNQKLLEDYRRIVEGQKADAQRIVDLAIQRNRAGHDLIRPEEWNRELSGPWLFPKPGEAVAEIRPRQFHELLVERSLALLEEGPLPPAALQDELERTELQFREQELRKDIDDALTDQERRQLARKLGDARLRAYVEHASGVNFYMSPSDLGIPPFSERAIPSLGELFMWQWDYWVKSDVLRALADANASASSMLDTPVQRVLGMQVMLPGQRLPSARRSGDDGGGSALGGGQGGSLRRGGAGGGDRGSSGGGDGGAGTMPSPSQPIAKDFSASITGRTSNSVYDVRYVRLGLLVASKDTPKVLEALSSRNFMSVVSMNVRPRTPFDDIERGYYYGPTALLELDLVIETVWLREWMIPMMPNEMRERLGIPVESRADGEET